MMKNYWCLVVVLIFSVVFIPNLSAQTSIVINGDIETIEPGFWSKLNGDAECIWATDTAAATFNSRRSFKIVKSAASSNEIGWRSDNNADNALE